MKSSLPVLTVILFSFALLINVSAAGYYSPATGPAADDTLSSVHELLKDTLVIDQVKGMGRNEVTGANISDSSVRPTDTVQAMPPVEETGAGEQKSKMDPLLFLIIALITGAAARYFLKKSPVPYTAFLLITGLLLGAANRLGWFDLWHLGSLTLNISWLGQSVGWAGKIDPLLILFIFLPVLIFEATLRMDIYTFKKTFTNSLLLALPGIIIALMLTAVIAMGMKAAGLGLAGWEWPVAFLFGTVASATDPAAVIAILGGMGAGKKLNSLFEGEYLLSNGIAIVIFLLLLFSIMTSGSDPSPVIGFIKASAGGIIVGLIISWITILWVRKVFNDAMLEITVIIAAALLTFFIAEHLFHGSGVLGLVALGLVLGSVKKTKISMEAGHFLREFWKLAAFVVNTLIFIIAGIVLAGKIHITAPDLLTLFIIYIGIHVIRALVILVLYPFMQKTGYGLTRKNALVLWYGALRGPIGLALALIVAGGSIIPEETGNDFLFLTAGLVLLTLLINAPTIKYLVRASGLAKIVPVRTRMIYSARNSLRQGTENVIDKLKEDQYLKQAHWDAVSDFLPEKVSGLNESAMQPESTIAEIRMRILEKEKSSYRNQFREGMLGPTAYRRLSEAVGQIVDEGGLVSLAKRKDLEQLWETPLILVKLQSLPVIGRLLQKIFFDRMALSYDSARGFVAAQEENLILLESMAAGKDGEAVPVDEKLFSIIREEIHENKNYGQAFLRNLGDSYPEISAAVTTRQAIRSVLNYEKSMVDTMLDKGLIDNFESDKLISGIGERMKRMLGLFPSLKLHKPVDLLREISWLNGLEEEVFIKVVESFSNRIYAANAILVKENGPGNGLFIISRGQVRVQLKDLLIDMVGPGGVIGEMAVLTGLPRTATVKAETPVQVLWISTTKMQALMKGSKELENRLWKFACTRFAMNLLSARKPYNDWQQKEFRQWLATGEIMYPDNLGRISLKGNVGILLTGQATNPVRKETLTAPTILESDDYIFSSNTRVFIREK